MGWRQQSRHMPSFFLSIFRFVRLLLSGHGAVAMENAALRVQLAAFQRMRKRPVLTPSIGCSGGFVPRLAGLAKSAAVRETGHGDSVATRTVSQILGPVVPAAAP
jgi:hypothetical protein